MLRNFYLFLILISLLPAIVFAQTATLKGHITDGKTNEPLPGAVVRFDDLKNVVSANEKGEYTLLNIAPGEYKVKVKFIGYSDFEKKIKLSARQVFELNIQL